MPLHLRIELASDMAPGSGSGTSGGIDRDIVFDARGLPLIPGRRLKGALREAAQEVMEALTLAAPAITFQALAVDRLFGQPGLRIPGWFHVDDARLEDAERLDPWLHWAAGRQETVFGRDSLIQVFTALRAQTSTSRLTGGPAHDTLRITRVLARGTVFVAPIELHVPPGDATDAPRAEKMLALACAAVRHLGLSRNRGLGEVRVTLREGPRDRTVDVLASL